SCVKKRIYTFDRKSIRKTRRLKSLPLRLVGMLSLCYRQIFIRRPFRSGRVCAFLCDGLLVYNDNVLWFFGPRFSSFLAEPYPFAVMPSLSRDLRAVAILNSLR